MKCHKILLLMLRNGALKFWTTVNFEVEYFLNEETEGVLTDTVIYFYDQHLTRAPLGGLFRVPLSFSCDRYLLNQCRYRHQTYT